MADNRRGCRWLAMACCAVVALFVAAGTASAVAYYGSLQYDPPPPPNPMDGLYVGPNGLQWETYTVTIEWWVTDGDPSYPGYPWKYTYRFRHNGTQAAISHIIIEASEGIALSDIAGLSTNVEITSIGLQTVLAGNPNMPEDIIGIRFRPKTPGTMDLTWTFFSNREPVWGDFYARCGGMMGGINYAINYNRDVGGVELGFLDPNNNDTIRDDPDPSAPPANGSFQYHILRPNSYAQAVIPEPTTVVLLGLGLVAVARRRVRRW